MTSRKPLTFAAGTIVILLLSSTSVRADLVDHYEFEGSAVDAVGGDANGTVGANVTFAPGKYGQAAVFGTTSTGSDDRIEVPRSLAFDPGLGDFSIAFWVKRDQADANEWDGVLDSSGGSSGYRMMFTGGWPPGWEDRMRSRINDSSGNVVEFNSSNTVGDTTGWHHFALTFVRATDVARIYVDGVLRFTWNGTGMTDAVSPSQDLRIGEFDGHGLDGRLDDLRIYDHALSAMEVQELVPESMALVDHYVFENDGVDSAGGDANGTVGANVTFGPGVSDQAAVFGTPSVGNAITVPSALAFNPGMSNFSVSFWVKRDQADIDDDDGILDCLDGAYPGYQFSFDDPGGAQPDKLKFTFRDAAGYLLDFHSGRSMPYTDHFHHYVLTVDRTSKEARIYIDGMLDVVRDFTLNSGIYPYSDLHIGRLNVYQPWWDRGLDGRLDDLRFYSYLLSDLEVAELAGIAGQGLYALLQPANGGYNPWIKGQTFTPAEGVLPAAGSISAFDLSAVTFYRSAQGWAGPTSEFYLNIYDDDPVSGAGAFVGSSTNPVDVAPLGNFDPILWTFDDLTLDSTHEYWALVSSTDTAGGLDVYCGMRESGASDPYSGGFSVAGTSGDPGGFVAKPDIDLAFHIALELVNWTDLGQGLGGALGVPLLTGAGHAAPSQEVALTTTDVQPLAAGFLVLGFSEIGLPVLGGTLVPAPDAIVPHASDGSGVAQLTTTFSPNLLPGVDLYLQAWFLDATGPLGVTASNAVLATTQ